MSENQMQRGLIILAWGLLKAYDLPIREWLKEHWLKK